MRLINYGQNKISYEDGGWDGDMRKKLLVFTSTFPRWKNDTIPSFVYEFWLSKKSL